MSIVLHRVAAALRRSAFHVGQLFFSRRSFADHERIQRRLTAIESLQTEHQKLQRVIAHDIVRLTARINASDGSVPRLATKDQLAAVRSDAADRLNALKLQCDQEAVDAGAHRSYMRRELDRASEEWVAHRVHVETALSEVVAGLARLERLVNADARQVRPAATVAPPSNGSAGASQHTVSEQQP